MQRSFGYRSLVPAPLGRGIEHDVALSHLAALQGHRVDPLQVRLAPDPLPDDMLSHLRAAGAGIVEI